MKLARRRWGSGDRRILLLHGLSSNAAGWWRVAPWLADAGWSVTAPDLRGHGSSPRGSSYRFADYAEDVLALGGGWEAVVGHSLGGAAAVVAHGADRDWTQRLVLQDPALLLVEAARDEVVDRLLEPYSRPLTPAAVAEDNPRWHPEDCRIKAEAMGESGPDVVRSTVADNRPWNVLSEARHVEVPTTVLGSDPAAGGIVAIAIGEWMAAENQLIDYRLLAGAGHSAHRETDVFEMYLAELARALGDS